ncbi:MAG TPA: diaminopimelate epimerase [Vicinamibacterales bacterium]|nr:diaminopimelate epimerase [Vicinamibacterales bacterium]
MPTGISVIKGHAYGNDFLMAPEPDVQGRDLPALARAMCSRQEGIGADGLMIYAFERSGVRMRLFNADGSLSEVSGNGIRCLAVLAVRERPGTQEVTIDTPAGPKLLQLQGQSGSALTFRASMGVPQDIRPVELEAAGEKIQAVALSVGNPQCVLLDDPLLESRLHTLGPAIEHHPKFPDRTNVSFAKVEAPNRVRVLIWERGVGPTQASGTGACGAAVAAALYGGASKDVEVISPGGSQRVEWLDTGLFLTGWAKLVFEGTWLG